MANYFVVAKEDYVGTPLARGGGGYTRIKYLGTPTPWRPDTREWWWVEPSQAADREGVDDYTRFYDSADAAAWVLKLQQISEEWNENNTSGVKIYVREMFLVGRCSIQWTTVDWILRSKHSVS